MRNLVDIVWRHATEGEGGWPSTKTRDDLIEQYIAMVGAVTVFAAAPEVPPQPVSDAQAAPDLHAWRFTKEDGQWSPWIVLPDTESVAAFKDLMGHNLERGTHQLQSFFAAPSSVSSTSRASLDAERCPTCNMTDAGYSVFIKGWCRDPWHGDDHLRAKASALSSTPRGTGA